jgi:hypothetical protein
LEFSRLHAPHVQVRGAGSTRVYHTRFYCEWEKSNVVGGYWNNARVGCTRQTPFFFYLLRPGKGKRVEKTRHSTRMNISWMATKNNDFKWVLVSRLQKENTHNNFENHQFVLEQNEIKFGSIYVRFWWKQNTICAGNILPVFSLNLRHYEK